MSSCCVFVCPFVSLSLCYYPCLYHFLVGEIWSDRVFRFSVFECRARNKCSHVECASPRMDAVRRLIVDGKGGDGEICSNEFHLAAMCLIRVPECILISDS